MELFWLLVVVVFIGVEISASRRQKIYDRDEVYVRTKIEGKTYWLRMDLGYGDPMPKVGDIVAPRFVYGPQHVQTEILEISFGWPKSVPRSQIIAWADPVKKQ